MAMDFMTSILAVVTVLVAGLMEGCEFSVAAFVQPFLNGLPDAEQARGVKTFAVRLGSVMPIWYAATFLLTAALTWQLHRNGSPSFGLVLMSAVLTLVITGFTIVFELPVNNRLASIDPSAMTIDWKRDSTKFDALHRIRVAGLIVAFALLAGGMVRL